MCSSSNCARIRIGSGSGGIIGKDACTYWGRAANAFALALAFSPRPIHRRCYMAHETPYTTLHCFGVPLSNKQRTIADPSLESAAFQFPAVSRSDNMNCAASQPAKPIPIHLPSCPLAIEPAGIGNLRRCALTSLQLAPELSGPNGFYRRRRSSGVNVPAQCD